MGLADHGHSQPLVELTGCPNLVRLLLDGKVVKVLDYRPRGPRFQPHYSNRDFVQLGVYSALPQKMSKSILNP